MFEVNLRAAVGEYWPALFTIFAIFWHHIYDEISHFLLSILLCVRACKDSFFKKNASVPVAEMEELVELGRVLNLLKEEPERGVPGEDHM